MNLSPSQNNLLKTLAISPLQVVMSDLQFHVAQQASSQSASILSLNHNLLLDLQILLPELNQVSFGTNFSIQADNLVVPEGFSFTNQEKKQLWQFLQQQLQA